MANVFYTGAISSKFKGMVNVSVNLGFDSPNRVYADNGEYIVIPGKRNFTATLECFTFPTGIDLSDDRQPFDLVFTVQAGSYDPSTGAIGYSDEAHTLKGCMVTGLDATYNTLTDTVEPSSFTLSVDFKEFV